MPNVAWTGGAELMVDNYSTSKDSVPYFWNRSHAIPLQRVLVYTKIIIPYNYKRIWATQTAFMLKTG